VYWVVDTTEHQTPLRESKWLTVINKIANKHIFDHQEFSSCQHDLLDNLVDDNGRQIQRIWTNKGGITEW